MTVGRAREKGRAIVIPAQAGIQIAPTDRSHWIPACAGMTQIGAGQITVALNRWCRNSLAAMARIENSDQFQQWLEDKPAEWAQALAIRSALRSLPHALSPDDMPTGHLAVPHWTAQTIRATIISWAARNCPAHDAVKPAAAAAAAAAGNEVAGASNAAAAAVADAAAGHATNHNALVSAVRAVGAASYYAADPTTSDAVYWQPLGEDCDVLRIATGADAQAQSLALLGTPLWAGGQMPPSINGNWERAVSKLGVSGLRFWLLWYQRRLAGEASGFALPPEQDLIVQGRLLEQTDDWWTGGRELDDLVQFQKVTREIEGWVNERRRDAVTRTKSELSEQFLDARRLVSELKLDSKELNPVDQSPPLGHNNPPSEIDDLLEQGQDLVDSESEDVELYKNLRDNIQRWAERTFRWGAEKADRFVDAAIDSMGKTAGKTVGIGVPVYVAFGDKIAQILESLNKLIGLIG